MLCRKRNIMPARAHRHRREASRVCAPAVVFESGSACDGDALAGVARGVANFTRAQRSSRDHDLSRERPRRVGRPLTQCRRLRLGASARQFSPGRHYGATPLAVITAGMDEWDRGFRPDVARAQQAAWMHAQQEMLLSAASRQSIAPESNHSMQGRQPDLVVAVLRELVQGMRG